MLSRNTAKKYLASIMVFALIFTMLSSIASANAVLVSVYTNKETSTIDVGTSEMFTLTAYYGGSVTDDVTQLADWSSDDTSVATVDVNGQVTAVSGGTATITGAYGGYSATIEITVPGALPIITSLTATPSSLALHMDDTAQPITITANWSNNTTTNVTGLVDWTISNSDVVDFDSASTFLPISVGTATINAVYNNVSVDIPVTVNPVQAPTLNYITLNTDNTTTMAVGDSITLVVTGHYSDNSTADLTSQATFVSNFPNSLSVGPAGVMTALSTNFLPPVVTVSVGDVQASVMVTINSGSPVLQGITAGPSAPSLIVGQTQQLTVTGNYLTGGLPSVVDVTNSSAYVSSDEDVATVSSAGLITAVGIGSATVTVTNGAFTSTVDVTVTAAPPTFTGLWIDSTNVTITQAVTHQIVLKANYSDDSQIDIAPTQATYSSNNPFIQVSASGVISSIAMMPGITGVVTVIYNNLPPITINVTVAAIMPQPTLLAMTATPGYHTLVVGQTAQSTVSGLFSDASTADVTSQVVWTTSDATRATVSSTGLITAIAPNLGPVTITGTIGSVVVNIPIAITAVPVTTTSVTIQGNYQNNSVPVGTSGPVIASALMSDMTSISNLGSLATWTSSDASVATIDNTGFVNTLSVGTTTITVTYGGQTDSVVLTVVPVAPTVTGITVSPATTTATVGGTRSLAVTAAYSDTTTATVTSQATYSSSNTSVATVSTAGVITAVHYGTATITVSFSGHTATSVVTVNSAVVTTPPPVVAPPTATIPTVPTLVHPVANQDIVSNTLIMNILTKAATGTAPNFVDVPATSWSSSVVDKAAKMGIVDGKDAEHFDPNGKVTRAEFSTMIMRAFGITPTQGQSFDDIQGHWAAESIQTLVNKGILKGYTDGTFQPEKEITREEMAAVLARMINFVKPETNQFADSANSWAVNEINALANAGVVGGVGNGQFNPQGDATRAESVAMIVRLMETLVKPADKQA
ncbi:Ig-like domain-containing protein [Paenibacillus glycanilyticus]|uniref:Ig-like domain-containing protein n=1 Tax=Paenibacillus glycanilyticus TaxID=126569 RepID=UPI000FD74547|nr:Ig-like domain-containing protein [Paenibacillus glycanilyticus]